MKFRKSAIAPILASIAGSFGYSWGTDNTILKVLEKENFKVLSLNKDDESWLVLAQQYREAGAVQPKDPRNFEQQEDPKFLDQQFWLDSIKGKSGFENDEEIAKKLKNACSKAFKLQYSGSKGKFYNAVKRWCSLKLPDYVLDSLKIQKSYGSCRLWLINSSKAQTGWYPWEAIGHTIDSVSKMGKSNNTQVNRLKYLKDSLEHSEYKEVIKKACQEKPNQLLELAWWPVGTNKSNEHDSKVWQPATEWKSEYQHKLPEARN